MDDSGRWRQHSTDESGRRLRRRASVDLGDHLPEDPTYDFAKSVWDIGPRGFPGADVRLDGIHCGDGLAVLEDGDGAPEPDARELTVVDEATGVSPIASRPASLQVPDFVVVPDIVVAGAASLARAGGA